MRFSHRDAHKFSDWVTEAITREAEDVLAQRLRWARALGPTELARYGAHEMSCEVLGPRSDRKYAHVTNVLGDAPLQVVVEVYAYDADGGWSDVLANGDALVEPQPG